MSRSLTTAVVALAVLLALGDGAPSWAAKVTCPNARYVLVTGGDLIADVAGVPPSLEIADGTATVLGGCPLLKGRAKPKKNGVHVSGRLRECGGRAKLKLKAVIPAGCATLAGTIRSRGVAPVTVAGQLSTCGNGVIETALGEQCDVGVPCPNATTCSQTCTCGGGTGSTTTTIPSSGAVSVTVDDAFCTADACTCGANPGLDYHLQSIGTATGAVGTEVRVNVNAIQGGQLDCGTWSPIGASVNPACVPIKCCRREEGQPETTNWSATEAIDLPCICPSSSVPLLHNYLAQGQLAAGIPVEAERTTTPCP